MLNLTQFIKAYGTQAIYHQQALLEILHTTVENVTLFTLIDLDELNFDSSEMEEGYENWLENLYENAPSLYDRCHSATEIMELF